MNSNNYFNYDGCYKPPATIPDISFQTNLRKNFYQTTVSSVKECETQSLRNNSDYFLINGINTTLNNINTNCYIPKLDNTNPSLFGSNSIIAKGQQLFDELFIQNNTYFKQTGNIDICDNLMFNKNKELANQRCFKYTVDNQYYTPNSHYAYYKKPILNTNNINIAKNLPRPQSYKDQLVGTTGLKSYEELLRINSSNIDNSGPLTYTFKNYVCNPNQTTLSALNSQLTILTSKYENFNISLDNIARDLSAISYLNSFDDDTLKAINLNIISKSKELSSLLGSGGANSGRLDDTTLLTQFKIVENSILLLVIISAIFYFTKKKSN
jgi:hypothetical protein